MNYCSVGWDRLLLLINLKKKKRDQGKEVSITNPLECLRPWRAQLLAVPHKELAACVPGAEQTK